MLHTQTRCKSVHGFSAGQKHYGKSGMGRGPPSLRAAAGLLLAKPSINMLKFTQQSATLRKYSALVLIIGGNTVTSCVGWLSILYQVLTLVWCLVISQFTHESKTANPIHNKNRTSAILLVTLGKWKEVFNTLQLLLLGTLTTSCSRHHYSTITITY